MPSIAPTKPQLKEIEKFFLSTILRVCIGGVTFILISDILFYPEDRLSIWIDIVILTACFISYWIRYRYPNVAVINTCAIILAAMFYQSLVIPINTNTSLSIILVVGFTISVMLKKQLLWIAHGITFITIMAIFIIQFLTPHLRFTPKLGDVATVSVTYSVLYFILTYATLSLKNMYDKMHDNLEAANKELAEKAMDIEAQNEELIQIQDNLSELNKDLERLVNERTERLQRKTKTLIEYTEKITQYSYSNAHHLRGPVARLLGLVALTKLNTGLDHEFFYKTIEDQANEIDTVVKQINIELEIEDFEMEDGQQKRV